MKYTGSLGKTIAKKRMGLLAEEDDYQAEARLTMDEMFSKLPALFKAHDVIEGNFVALALALAKAHVPGFKVVRPAGRKTEWHSSVKAEFRLDVDAIVLESGARGVANRCGSKQAADSRSQNRAYRDEPTTCSIRDEPTACSVRDEPKTGKARCWPPDVAA